MGAILLTQESQEDSVNLTAGNLGTEIVKTGRVKLSWHQKVQFVFKLLIRSSSQTKQNRTKGRNINTWLEVHKIFLIYVLAQLGTINPLT